MNSIQSRRALREPLCDSRLGFLAQKIAVLFCIFVAGVWPALATAQFSLIDSTLTDQPGGSITYLGTTPGEEYAFSLLRVDTDDITNRDYYILRKAVDGIGTEDAFVYAGSFFLLRPSDIAFSDDGRYVTWVDGPGSPLQIHDLDLDQSVEVPMSLNDQFEFYRPGFLADAPVATFRAESRDGSGAQENQRGRLLLDIETLETQYIDIENLQPLHGSDKILNFKSKVSGDGSAILFQTYVQATETNRLIHHDIASGNNTLIYTESIDFCYGFDISRDGRRIVYCLDDPSGEQFKGQLTVRLLGSSVQQQFRVHKLNYIIDANDDLSRLLMEGGIEYQDSRTETNLLALGNVNNGFIQDIPRRTPIVVLDVPSGQFSITNRVSQYQLIEQVPLHFIRNGAFITSQVELTGLAAPGLALVSQRLNFDYEPDASVTGLWYQASASGQGVSIHVVPDANDKTGKVVLLWATQDNDGSPLWIYMEGFFDGDTVSGTAYLTETPTPGGQTTQAVGELSMRFDSCRSARLTFDVDRLTQPQGSIPLTRLAFQKTIGCL